MLNFGGEINEMKCIEACLRLQTVCQKERKVLWYDWLSN